MNAAWFGIGVIFTANLAFLQNMFTECNRIQSQNCNVVCIICGKLALRKRKYDSSTDALRQLHWLPIRARVEFKIALTVYKCMIGDAPEYLKDMLHHSRPKRYTRSSADSLLLDVPKIKCKTFADHAFSVVGPKTWNGLPYITRDCDSTISFKKKLKTHLFKHYFNH